MGFAGDWFRAGGDALSPQSALTTLTPFYLIAIALFLALARVQPGGPPASIHHNPPARMSADCLTHIIWPSNARRAPPPG